MVGQLLLKELEMPPAHRSATLIAIIFWMTSSLAAGAAAAGRPVASSSVAAEGDGVAERAPTLRAAAAPARTLAGTLNGARALLKAGYARAPALVIVLGACIALPVVALISCFVQWVVSRRRLYAAMRAAQLRALEAEPAEDMPSAEALPLWSHEAWLTVEGTGAGTLPLDTRRMRIGRHRDNDVLLADAAVDRYHAVIERTPEAFVIVDVSGKDGSGVRINGERQARAQLCDGDVIELGRTRLKFECAPV